MKTKSNPNRITATSLVSLALLATLAACERAHPVITATNEAHLRTERISRDYFDMDGDGDVDIYGQASIEHSNHPDVGAQFSDDFRRYISPEFANSHLDDSTRARLYFNLFCFGEGQFRNFPLSTFTPMPPDMEARVNTEYQGLKALGD